MATVIHHGPPGSYKSFALTQRFAIPALVEGRTLVTNVRGLNDLDLIIEQFPDLEFSQDAKIIFVDTGTAQGRLRMAQWFHWIPVGALVLIDEVQQIYPMRRDFKLESLDKFTPLEGEVIDDSMLVEPRPYDIFVAFDKQRHYNWDLYCSTTNIAKVNKEIRQVADWAYRHRDLSGLLPWKKNTWVEHQHDPESSGKAASSTVGTPQQYKADTRVFKCYASTATGEHVKSNTTKSILKDQKILLMVGIVVVCLIIAAFAYNRRFNKPQALPSPTSIMPSSPPSVVTVANTSNIVVAHGVSDKVSGIVGDKPLAALERPQVVNWSVSGVPVDFLPILPRTCSFTSRLVKCRMSPKNYLLSFSSNRFCKPVGNHSDCYAIFFIKHPSPVNADDKPLLASLTNAQPLLSH